MNVDSVFKPVICIRYVRWSLGWGALRLQLKLFNVFSDLKQSLKREGTYLCLRLIHVDIYGRNQQNIVKQLSSNKKSVQFSRSVVSNSLQPHGLPFVTLWTAACQASLSVTNFQSLLKLMSIESVMPSNHLIFCHLLLLPSIFPSTRVFSEESVLRIRWPKYWSFSFSISPSNKKEVNFKK